VNYFTGMAEVPPINSFECKAEVSGAVCALTYTLKVEDIIQSVKDDRAGAVAGMQ
jgi:hypothetical protein